MDLYSGVNGSISLLVALSLSYTVMTPRFQEGIIIKLGLIMMIFSLLSTAYFTFSGRLDWEALWNAWIALQAGIFVVLVGYYARAYKAKNLLRRATDWGELVEAIRADRG